VLLIEPGPCWTRLQIAKNRSADLRLEGKLREWTTCERATRQHTLFRAAKGADRGEPREGAGEAPQFRCAFGVQIVGVLARLDADLQHRLITSNISRVMQRSLKKRGASDFLTNQFV
jgi:hypothetical protein